MTNQAISRLAPPLATFAATVVETGGDTRAAAIAAGVHPTRARVWARQALADPTVRSAIDTALRARIVEAGPIAVATLIQFAKNPTGPDGKLYCSRELQLAAAKDLATRAGVSATSLREATAPDLTEMTPEQLRHVLETTESELASRAKEAANAPVFDATGAQAIDPTE